jgi:hypothetical protein
VNYRFVDEHDPQPIAQPPLRSNAQATNPRVSSPCEFLNDYTI